MSEVRPLSTLSGDHPGYEGERSFLTALTLPPLMLCELVRLLIRRWWKFQLSIILLDITPAGNGRDTYYFWVGVEFKLSTCSVDTMVGECIFVCGSWFFHVSSFSTTWSGLHVSQWKPEYIITCHFCDPWPV